MLWRALVATCSLVVLYCATLSAQQFDSPPASAAQPIQLMLSPDLFTGTLNIAVPIDLPLSGNTLAPFIQLQHQGGIPNGWVGVDWRLELGAIEKNPAFGTFGTCEEKNPLYACYLLSFQGARIPVIGTSGGKFYERQQENFFRIEKLPADAGTFWWRVTDKKGTQYEFGNSSDSLQGGAKPVKWLLKTILDTNGNVVRFTYQSVGSDVYPLSVEYLFSVSRPQRSIKVMFELEDRPDISTSYQYGVEITTTKRLKRIRVVANGVDVEMYELNYGLSTVSGRSMLQSVSILGSTDHFRTPLAPSIQLSYTQPANNWVVPQPTFTGGPPAPMKDIRLNCLTGDFNGDGRTDFACYRGYYNHWQVSLSDGHQWNSTSWPGAADSPTPQANYCFAADFNGDGKTDLACQIPALPIGTWSVALSTGSGFQQPPTTWPNGPTIAPPMAKQCLTGDFDGNADADIACYVGNGNWQVALSTGQKWLTAVWPGGPSPVGVVPEHCFAADVDGDGKAELICTDGNGAWSVAKGATDHWITTPWVGPSGALSTRCFIGDFNGDGLTDVVCHDDTQNKWMAGISTGSGWKLEDWGSDLTFTAGQCAAGDFNGDGMTDIACFAPGSSSSQVALSTGVGFTVTPWAATTAYQNPHNCIVGDFLGDGKSSIACMIQNGFWSITSVPVETADAIKTVVNPLGGKSEFSYCNSTDNANNTLLPFDVPIVCKITLNAGGKPSIRQFKYDKGYFDLRRREFRGFGEVTLVDNPLDAAGNQQIYAFHQGVVSFGLPDAALGLIGKMDRVQITDKNLVPLRQAHFTYSLGSDVPPFFNPLTKTDNYVFDRNGNATILSIADGYDSYGNITFEQTSTPSGVEKTTTREFAIDQSDWIVSQMKKETIQAGDLSGPVLESVELYYDEPTSCAGLSSVTDGHKRGNVSRIVHWSDQGPSPETTFAYDQKGNLVCFRAPNGGETRFSYDSVYAVEPVRTLNALNRVTQIRYYGINSNGGHGRFGQISDVIGQNGEVSHLDYDDLGRPVTTTLPGNRAITTSYVGFGVPNKQNVLTIYGEGSSSTQYLDGIGRPTRVESTGANGSVIVDEQELDEYGLVKKSYYSHFSNVAASDFILTDHDELGRVSRRTNPDASSASWCYDGLRSAELDENGHFKVATFDVEGRIVRMEEFQGTVTKCLDALAATNVYSHTAYEYDAIGRVKTIVKNSGETIRASWNSAGQLSSLNDPNLGEKLFEYDVSGNLVRARNARHDWIEWEYDKLDRPVAKYFRHDGAARRMLLARFYYDSGRNAIGRLVRAKSKDLSSSYTYDTAGRVATIRSRVGIHLLRFQESYDSLDRLKSLRYPNGLTISYSYSGPSLSAIMAGKTVIKKTTGFTALGQPLNIEWATQLTTQYHYYQAGEVGCNKPLHVLCAVSTAPISGRAFELKYDYDLKGNVTMLAENGAQSQFSYDSLDRMIKADDGTATGVVQYSYDEVGNILSNSLLGRYRYDSLRPELLQSAGPNRYAYDADGNVISRNGTDLTFDAENKLRRVRSRPRDSSDRSSGGNLSHGVSFEYDANGNRVLMKEDRDEPFPVNVFVPAKHLWTFGKLYECGLIRCNANVIDGANVVAQVNWRKRGFAFQRDLLGSLRLEVHDGHWNGGVKYAPFGSPSISEQGTHTLDNSFLFTSQRYSESTGLYWYRTRDYDPVIGRFLTADVRYGNPAAPQAHNLYSYVRNNPETLTDPSGMDDSPPDDGTDDPTDGSSSIDYGYGYQTSVYAQNNIDYASFANTYTYASSLVHGDASASPPNAYATTNLAAPPRQSEIILSWSRGVTGSAKETFRYSLGHAISFDPVSGDVRYYPLHTVAMFIPPADSTMFGSTLGYQVSLGQGDIERGFRGESLNFLLGLGNMSGGLTRNPNYSGIFLEWGVGEEYGSAVGTSFTGAGPGDNLPRFEYGPPIVLFNIKPQYESVRSFLAFMMNYSWGESSRRR